MSPRVKRAASYLNGAQKSHRKCIFRKLFLPHPCLMLGEYSPLTTQLRMQRKGISQKLTPFGGRPEPNTSEQLKDEENQVLRARGYEL
eukprot:scaffold203507_cov18-Prasinocladus_malaysianus.AAC.1